MNTIVISSGNKYAFSQIGAIIALENKGILRDVKNFVGSSTGSILAYTLFAAYEWKEIIHSVKKVMRLLTFSIMDFAPKQVIDKCVMFGLVDKRDDKDKFVEVKKCLEDLIQARFSYIPTMLQLHEAIGKNLIICTFDVTTSTVIFIDHISHPEMLIVDALLMSIMSTYSVSNPICYHGHRYCDPTFVCPYPLVCETPIGLTHDNLKNTIGVRVIRKDLDGVDDIFRDRISTGDPDVGNVYDLISSTINRHMKSTEYVPGIEVTIYSSDDFLSKVFDDDEINNLVIRGKKSAEDTLR